MLEPVTGTLIFLGSAAINGVLEDYSSAKWDQFKHNLKQHRPYANHELRQAVYRAYLLATLQSCAALLERKNLKVEAWFKFGMLPTKMADAFRLLVQDASAGVFTKATKRWLEVVSRDHIEKLKVVNDRTFDIPWQLEGQ